MALLLQPGLRPWPAWLRRSAGLGALVMTVLLVGIAARPSQAVPQLLLSGPGHDLEYARAATRLIGQARTRVWLIMFVIRPGDERTVGALLDALAAAHTRGVDVRVCMDLGRDRMTGDIEEKHTAPLAWLRAHGIHAITDEDDRTTHAKVLLIDSRWAIVGSHNWTSSALTRNREASLLIDAPTLVRELETFCLGIPGWEPTPSVR